MLPRAEHEALEQTRRTTEAGRESALPTRGWLDIKGTVSQGVRGCGLRRSRYRGLAKTHLQNMAVGAAITIDHIVNWLNDIPIAKTHTSRFKALEPA